MHREDSQMRNERAIICENGIVLEMVGCQET